MEIFVYFFFTRINRFDRFEIKTGSVTPPDLIHLAVMVFVTVTTVAIMMVLPLLTVVIMVMAMKLLIGCRF